MLFITLIYHFNILTKTNSDTNYDEDEDPDVTTDSDLSEDDYSPNQEEINQEGEILIQMRKDGDYVYGPDGHSVKWHPEVSASDEEDEADGAAETA